MLLPLLWLLMPALAFADETHHVVARFSQGDMQGWREKGFSGHTRYALVTEEGRSVLRAQSQAAASGLYKEVRIDLRDTPYLNWSWKVAGVLSGNDERSREGDDYPARVYVVFSGGLLFWKTRAINYVWSSNQAVDSQWPNAYTDNARMIAVQSGAEKAGVWVHQRRNVLEDYQQQFGAAAHEMTAVAIMTDTDNTGGSALAWYGDIYFSAQ